jgi:RND family efflux transporter MFP subunit
VEIYPEVSGRVVETHPALEPGGIISAGDTLIKIDPEEYELALARAQGGLAEAEAALQVEEGRQLVARREWELFGKDLPNAELGQSLALREPQLRQAEARIASAVSVVKQAELDLKRTEIKAPFDVLVLEESVDKGQYVAPGSAIALLVGCEAFWVQAKVLAAHLDAVLEVAIDQAPLVRVYSETQGVHQEPILGKLLRDLGQVDPDGRMAQILVEVQDPLGLNAEPTERRHLPLNTYVRAELEAGTLEGAVTIPRQALRENDEIWVVNGESLLQTRQAQVLWRQGELVAVSNTFRTGERVVVSPVGDLLPGTKVRVSESERNPQPNTPTPTPRQEM